jgi:hypothetical protein
MDYSDSSDTSKPYSLPSQPPAIPLRPFKAAAASRGSSPDEDITPLEIAPVPSTNPPINSTSNKRSAPDDEPEEVASVAITKKQKVAVVEDDDDDFEIL